MLKSELRKMYLSKRKNLSEQEIDNLSQKIIKNFILQFNPTENQKIHCFLPIRKFNEISTHYLINYSWKNKIKVFVPKMDGEHLISIELKKDTILEENQWGILEPKSNENSFEKDFDFIITPLLYCDNEGNRVGYGKGFYDRLFTETNPCSKKIGVNFFPPKEQISDIWEEDIPLDYLICPEEILSFGTDTKLG